MVKTREGGGGRVEAEEKTEQRGAKGMKGKQERRREMRRKEEGVEGSEEGWKRGGQNERKRWMAERRSPVSIAHQRKSVV